MAHPQEGTTKRDAHADWAASLAALIDSQVSKYQELADITQAQSAAVNEGDTDALLSTLAKRQVVIQQITAANADLAPFIHAWQDHSNAIPPALADTIRSSMGQLDTLVQQINDADDRDRIALEEKRAAVSSELVGVTKRRTAMHAYAAKPASGPRFQDRNG